MNLISPDFQFAKSEMFKEMQDISQVPALLDHRNPYQVAQLLYLAATKSIEYATWEPSTDTYATAKYTVDNSEAYELVKYLSSNVDPAVMTAAMTIATIKGSQIGSIGVR